MTEPSADVPSGQPQRRWQPISALDRRVLGVLAEKAKTTPDVYPMSLNGICTGANQKSNRAPIMQLELDQVEESLDRLRQLGAVGMVEGYGRVQKYRHYLYEWLGVDKVELAVMTELLLRGDQTVGELRGRAARMEPIADLSALRPVLESLKAKGLVISLTPDGRGHVVTHALLKPREIESLREKYQNYSAAGVSEEDEYQGAVSPASHVPAASAPSSVGSPAAPSRSGGGGLAEIVQREIADLRTQVLQLRADLDETRAEFERVSDEVRTLKEALGG